MIKAALILLSVLLASSVSVSEKNHELEAIFQWDKTPTLPQELGESTLQQVTMGLTNTQIEQIYKLTQGRVNFKNIFRVKVSQTEDLQQLQAIDGFSSLTDNTVPPPAVFGKPRQPADMDPEYKGQWWVRDINATGISDEATGHGIIIADCDAGYFYDATDLEANMLYDLRYDFADKDDPYTIDDGGYPTHGTSVSAIMSGVLDGHGTNGIAYESQVVPLQNYNYSGKDDINKEEATAACVLHATQIEDVAIIVLENQTATGSSETFVGTRNAVRLAIEAGIHVVSAAGNYSKELIAEREDDTGSVIVGALETNGSTASFSNYGERITVAAFGRQLWTLRQRDGSMGNFGGTSGATPQVAGAVALILEVNPHLTPAQVRAILEDTQVKEGKNANVSGRLDVRAAVEMARITTPDLAGFEQSLKVRQILSNIL